MIWIQLGIIILLILCPPFGCAVRRLFSKNNPKFSRSAALSVSVEVRGVLHTVVQALVYRVLLRENCSTKKQNEKITAAIAMAMGPCRGPVGYSIGVK